MPRQMPLSRDNLTDAVSRAIQQMIARGEAAPGTWLPPQPELARELGVGLSTVREAVKGLTLLGILEPQPGRGTYVRDDAAFMLRLLDLLRTRAGDLDTASITDTRRLLEVELTALAAQNASPEDVARIEQALDRMGAALDDNAAYLDADMAFHLAVADAARNPLLRQFYHIAAELMNEVNEGFDTTDLNAPSLGYQRAILDAIRAGDPALARERAAALVDRWQAILDGEAG